jgi:hypothetical protein
VPDADARPEARSYPWTGSHSEARARTVAGTGTAAKAGAAPEAETPAGTGVPAQEPWSRDPRAGRVRVAARVHWGRHAWLAPCSPTCVRQVTRRVPVNVIGIPNRSSRFPGRGAVHAPAGSGNGGDRTAHCHVGARLLPGNQHDPPQYGVTQGNSLHLTTKPRFAYFL